MSMFRKAYSVAGALLILEYLTQFYLIATAMFTLVQAYFESEGNPSSKAIYASFKNADPIASLHVFNGHVIIPITTLVLIGLSFAARHPRKTSGLTALLFVLLLVQIALVWVGIPGVTALHALNAIVLLSLASWLTWTNWAWRTQSVPAKPVEAIPAATAR
jgi:hypothetical protein